MRGIQRNPRGQVLGLLAHFEHQMGVFERCANYARKLAQACTVVVYDPEGFGFGQQVRIMHAKPEIQRPMPPLACFCV